MTGSANCDIVSKGRRNLCGVKCIGVAEIAKAGRSSFLKMLQLAPLNRVPFGKFNRASAFPVVRRRRAGLASELE
jgi:hypothetical protein